MTDDSQKLGQSDIEQLLKAQLPAGPVSSPSAASA